MKKNPALHMDVLVVIMAIYALCVLVMTYIWEFKEKLVLEFVPVNLLYMITGQLQIIVNLAISNAEHALVLLKNVTLVYHLLLGWIKAKIVHYKIIGVKYQPV